MGSTIEFTRPDGQKAPGYFAPASSPHAPGVVLFEEWWGLDDRIKATAGDEANHLMEGLDFGDAATQDGVGAAHYLRERGAPRVGVMGFCMGGALALLSVMHAQEFDAASIWYGFPPAEAGDPAKIAVPIQGHWALEDGFFTIAGVDELEDRLRAGGRAPEFHRYQAKHGFYNEGTPGNGGLGHYDRDHAETAWRRTTDFFDRTLRA